jgi:uncharacterized protein YktB (UPF0637 family)
MATGQSAPTASLLDTFNNSVSGLEDAMGRLNESMINEPSLAGIGEKVATTFNSKKLNSLYDLIQRVDSITAALNQAATDLYKL